MLFGANEIIFALLDPNPEEWREGRDVLRLLRIHKIQGEKAQNMYRALDRTHVICLGWFILPQIPAELYISQEDTPSPGAGGGDDDECV